MKLGNFLRICLLVLIFSFLLVASLPLKASASNDSEYLNVDLEYLAAHMRDFCGKKVRTMGTVCFMASFYMYEDFWLGGAIPVVVRFAGLPVPIENSFIEVLGVIEYCTLEGGFFYLNAHSWAYVETTPEFQSLIMLPLLMLATLLAVITYRKNISW